MGRISTKDKPYLHCRFRAKGSNYCDNKQTVYKSTYRNLLGKALTDDMLQIRDCNIQSGLWQRNVKDQPPA